jgi:type IV pilus assembly protein PilM
MAGNVVTLFIDDTNIRLLEARGKRVQKWARLPLEPGLVRDGVILDEAQVADRLKELFALSKITARKVIAGLSGVNSLYRLITLPELPEAVQAEAVRHEARRVIPVSLDQVYLAYQPLPAPKGETRLFLVAFPRNAADALTKTLRQAGVEPYLMDLAPLALCRNANEPRAIIINAWSANLDIVVMVGRVPEVIRSLSLPSEAASLSEMLPAINEELERTITFYNTGHPETRLDSTVPILVSGDLAEAPESWQLLAGKSNYPVSILPSPLQSPEGFNPSQFMVNMGLALKELLAEKGEANFSLVNLNAVAEVYVPKAKAPVAGILIPIAIAIVGIGLLFYTVTLLQNSITQTDALSIQLASAERQVAEHRKEIGPLKEQIAQVEPQIAPIEATGVVLSTTFTTLEEGRAQVNGDMSQVVSVLPGTVDLTEVSHMSDNVTVGGIAPNEAEIFTYARSLRGSGRFSLVVISSITERITTIGEEEEEEEIREFTFEFLLK